MTVGGGNKGKECILPFIYNGKKYDHCIISKNGNNNKRWCSTMVDKGQHHVGDQGHWGYCSPSCPITPKRGMFKNCRSSNSSYFAQYIILFIITLMFVLGPEDFDELRIGDIPDETSKKIVK